MREQVQVRKSDVCSSQKSESNRVRTFEQRRGENATLSSQLPTPIQVSMKFGTSLLGARAPWGLIMRYLLSIVTAIVGTAIFFAAFFPGSRGPISTLHPGSNTTSTLDDNTLSSNGKDRIVIMLVDALRADFIWQNESRFEFVNDMIAAGVALPFTTRAHSPTVTLPRIKSMITGSIPGFLDIKANLGTCMGHCVFYVPCFVPVVTFGRASVLLMCMAYNFQ